MESRIIGTFNPEFINQNEIHTIECFVQDDSNYSEFRIGDWKTYVIRTANIDNDAGLVAQHHRPATVTAQGARLPGLNAWIDRTFDTRTLRLARIHCLGNGVLIPHRDFIELGPTAPVWARLHIPLKTNEHCLHSEESEVFRMRTGEIWQLAASRLHSATNFSEERRLNVCLDFELGDACVSSLLRDRSSVKNLPDPQIIMRQPIDEVFLGGLLDLSNLIDEKNFRDIVGLLSRVHFYKQATLAEFFDWLHEIAYRSDKPGLLDKAEKFSRFLRAERVMFERFVL
ncbi:aspartyl/asparaginyl beta-hydroxylase domain-containing protein [Pseudomonas sp. L1(2025)]|uniref:aspartyl/asparaginyl beta-hydroxylase domain-containing protein n=1 Tax=Pseudomonas sp. L1(2025) TaxID=3449429 RepID=UPI003F692D0A